MGHSGYGCYIMLQVIVPIPSLHGRGGASLQDTND